MKIYNDIEYARTRLQNSIVLYKGEPVLIHGITANGTVEATTLEEDPKVVRMKMSSLDINPVQLGYVNTRTNCYYLARTPLRRDWKQGIRENNIRIIRQDNNHPLRDRPSRVHWHLVANTIKNLFPSIEECRTLVERGFKESAAFSRNFAILRDNKLQLKGRWTIGKVDDNGFTLDEKFEWTREMLEEEIAA